MDALPTYISQAGDERHLSPTAADNAKMINRSTTLSEYIEHIETQLADFQRGLAHRIDLLVEETKEPRAVLDGLVASLNEKVADLRADFRSAGR